MFRKIVISRLTPDNRELVTEQLVGLWRVKHEHDSGVPR